MISPLRETCGKGEYKYRKGLEKKTGFGAEEEKKSEAQAKKPIKEWHFGAFFLGHGVRVGQLVMRVERVEWGV